jgi:hypothetical protein
LQLAVSFRDTPVKYPFLAVTEWGRQVLHFQTSFGISLSFSQLLAAAATLLIALFAKYVQEVLDRQRKRMRQGSKKELKVEALRQRSRKQKVSRSKS